MDIDMLFQDDDVPGPDLRDQPFVDRGEELGVEVLPQALLLQPWVHAREG
jgi:hypothetical protein